MKQRWEDCTIGFYCPNCNAELVADSQNESQECECGLSYSLVAYVKITPPNKGLHPTAAGESDSGENSESGGG